MKKQYLTLCAAALAAVVFQPAQGQEPQKHFCALFIERAKQDKPIAELNFEAPIGERKKTVKALRIPSTNLFLVVRITYSESNWANDRNPESTILEMTVSSRPDWRDGKGLVYSSSETKFDVDETSYMELSHWTKGIPTTTVCNARKNKFDLKEISDIGYTRRVAVELSVI
jgi:hypothetical protein